MYLLWFAKLSDQANPNKADLLTEAGRLLDNNVAPVQVQVNKPFIIALSYPSSTYSATGCIPNGSGGCYYWTALNRPNADLNTVNLDLQQQVDIYDAVFNAVNGRTWVSGLDQPRLFHRPSHCRISPPPFTANPPPICYGTGSQDCWEILNKCRRRIAERNPEEIVEIGFQRSLVVMLNEAHSVLSRSAADIRR